MNYSINIHPDCKNEINKACKRDPVLEKFLSKKMKEIVQNPEHYKPLRYDLKGERRVHIRSCFVLRFMIDENNHEVKFLAFKHHDDAYRR